MAALNQYFSADANALDFAGESEKARLFINKYVSDRTNHTIPELLAKGILEPLTRLVLISTVSFKGRWNTAFDQREKRDRHFYTDELSKQSTKMMHKTLRIPLHKNDEQRVSVASLKYNLTGPNDGEVMEMVIVLPYQKDGLSELEERIQETPALLWQLIELIDRANEVKVRVAVPRFKFAQTMDLVKQLQQLGIETLFSNNADLSGKLE